MNNYRGIAVVIEDDHDVSSLLAQVLSHQGLDVVRAYDGARGVEAVRLNVPLVTSVDLGVPGISGVDIVREIRKFSSTYIVVVTGRNEEDDVLEALAAGADAYITKPFRPRELRARVEAMVRRSSPALLAEAASRTRAQVSRSGLRPAQAAPAAPAASPVPAARPARSVPPLAPAALPDERPVWTPAVRPVPAIPDPVRVWTRGHPRESVIPPPASPPAPAPVAAPAAGLAPGVATPDPERSEPGPRDYEGAYDAAQLADRPESPLWSATPEADLAGKPAPAAWEFYRGLAVNRSQGRVEVDGRPIHLDAAELALLSALLDSGSRVRSRAELALVLLGGEGGGSSEAPGAPDTTLYQAEDGRARADAVIDGLLTKLREDPHRPRWIETIPGVGFRRVTG